MTDAPLSPAQIRRLLEGRVLIDTHNDLLCGLRRWEGYAVGGFDGARPSFHTDLPRLRAGAVTAQVWSVFASSRQPEAEAVVGTLEQIDAAHRFAAAHPRDLAIVRTADEAEHAIAQGRIASFLGVEGGQSIAGSLGVLRMLARLGVRLFSLTHTTSLDWADSATDTARAGGLTADGVAIVGELERLGVVIDLSHTSERTQRAVLDVARAPLLFSHSGVAAVAEHPRNVGEDVLHRLAGQGGVLQVAFVAQFLSREFADWSAEADGERGRLGIDTSLPWPRAPRPAETADAARAANRSAMPAQDPSALEAFSRWALAHPAPRVTVGHVADHVEAARDTMGVAHVGLGSDFDGVADLPDGLGDVAGYPLLLAELSARGWSPDDLLDLAGRNTMRVLRATEATAD
ncbi:MULTISPECIES: dipeptidase [unclassified Rathayibacter]|uniref:dipeptidase n=1 Tax=unclassified Rathayibacter TaxID=2609250 RepID=UPI0010443EA9|nr:MULTISPECIES: dipeptidase [unclassified Rathayibacter]TCL82257.1 membrane dipeptidase [Rathayibacter sp. PhB192]TCM27473.1 membrane dipeptidase [Rathayibacter sp. PhB179]